LEAVAWEQLTDRERQILRLLLERQTPDEIAKQLAISRASVQRHLKNALGKLAPGVGAGLQRRQAQPTPLPGRLLGASELYAALRELAQRHRRYQRPWAVAALVTAHRLDPVSISPLLTVIRSSDYAGWWDDAFVVLLPDTAVEGAQRLLGRLSQILGAALVVFGAAAVEPLVHEPSERTIARARTLATTALLEAEARRAAGLSPDPG
jgi:DNA-binding Lrp family transcriptional regulator